LLSIELTRDDSFVPECGERPGSVEANMCRIYCTNGRLCIPEFLTASMAGSEAPVQDWTAQSCAVGSTCPGNLCCHPDFKTCGRSEWSSLP